MAVQVVLIDQNGDPLTVITPGTDEMYQDGQQYGDYIAKHIPSYENAASFLASKYYDFELDDFATRMTKPSEFHRWDKILKEWYFDKDRALVWVRIERNKRLAACDWTQVSDAPLTEEQKLSWQAYRQALRDFPETLVNIGSMEEIVWP